MTAPRKVVTQSQAGSDQRSNGWVVCFVSYDNPVPNYFRDDNDTFRIITNDAVSVSVSNSKGSFGKTAQISLKSTDDFYPSLVSNGDWCFVWMVDSEIKRIEIESALSRIAGGGTSGNILVDYESGLKFVGRVTSCNSTDIVQGNGPRTINQSISAQCFLEFASTVYYTGTIVKLEPLLVNPEAKGVEGQQDAAARLQDQSAQFQIIQSLEGFTKGLATKFKDLMNQGNENNSPDKLISLYYLLSMGVDKPQKLLGGTGIPTTFNSGITIPSKVSAIFNKPKAKKLWQLIDVHAGIQKFTADKLAWYKGFVPNLKSDAAENLKTTGTPTKGFVPFKFELWSNMSLWSIFSKHLNPVVNEMFTSLRLNQEGNLNLTLTIREKPFSTGLFNHIKDEESYYTGKSILPKNPITGVKQSGSEDTPPETVLQKGKTKGSREIFRTLYGEVPRWVIDDSIVKSYSSSTNENDRINFVMVWGKSSQAEMLDPKINLDNFMSQQFNKGNFYQNPGDVSRNGLRSMITESYYDTLHNESGIAGSQAQLWARMNADWLFNGHLKLHATLTLNGVQDPIVEGDNVEYRGILYHIESVSHSATLAASGQKTWVTTLSLSNGMLASSFDNLDSVPLYAFHQTKIREELKHPLAPGVTSYKEGN